MSRYEALQPSIRDPYGPQQSKQYIRRKRVIPLTAKPRALRTGCAVTQALSQSKSTLKPTHDMYKYLRIVHDVCPSAWVFEGKYRGEDVIFGASYCRLDFLPLTQTVPLRACKVK